MALEVVKTRVTDAGGGIAETQVGNDGGG